jgi:hypothetical protein
MPEFIGDVLLDIFEARAPNHKLLLPVASLQVEALRCCTKILQAYEHRMKAFDKDILEFFSATVKRLGQIYVNTDSNTNNNNSANIEFNPEFGALYSKIEGEVKNEVAKTYNEMLLRGIEYILSLIQIDNKLVAEFGSKIVPSALVLFNSMTSHKERIELVELIGQICLLGLDKQHRSIFEGFVKRQKDDEDDDEDPYEDDDEAELEEEEEDEDEQTDKAALWNPIQSTPFGLIESAIKTAINIYFMEVNGEEEKEELGSIPFLMSILLGITSAYYAPQQHISLFNSVMDLFIPKFESYAGQVVSSDFLSAIKMVLDNASSNAVNPHFIKLFDLIEKSLDDAKEWLKTPPTTKGKRKQYNKIRLAIIRAMGALLKSSAPNMLLRAEHFYHECLANFADPILLSQFVVGLSDLLKREDVPDPLEAIEANGGTFVEKGKPLNFIQARGKMRDSYVQYIVNQLVGELQKLGTSKNIKQMILTSMEILILRVEPRWLEAYSQILISNLQQALKNQLMAVGLKAVKCLHLIFVQLKDNAKIHANLDEVTRDLVVLIKEDWNPNKPEHSDEDEGDEDSIEVDIAPKLALQAMKFFKSVYSLPELCAIANEKLSKIFVRNLFEFLLASMNKEIFFDDDVDLRFAQQELVDLMYKNVPYLFQDACKQKYVRALKAVIIHAQEADIDVLVEKMESCLDALIGGV